jgi:hypothetical protein
MSDCGPAIEPARHQGDRHLARISRFAPSFGPERVYSGPQSQNTEIRWSYWNYIIAEANQPDGFGLALA